MSAPINDGGRAFPEVEGGYSGMSLRDWFAGHAPKEPQDWFIPVIEPRPTMREGAHWCIECLADGDCLRNADCDELRKHLRDLTTWTESKAKEKLLQWPFAWADEMIKRMIK